VGKGKRHPPPRKKESHSHGLSAIVIAGVDIELDCRDFGVDLSDHYRGPSIRVAFLFAGGCGLAWCWGGLGAWRAEEDTSNGKMRVVWQGCTLARMVCVQACPLGACYV
jgi:hypothetical protein